MLTRLIITMIIGVLILVPLSLVSLLPSDVPRPMVVNFRGLYKGCLNYVQQLSGVRDDSALCNGLVFQYSPKD